jgi:hypothetical protein
MRALRNREAPSFFILIMYLQLNFVLCILHSASRISYLHSEPEFAVWSTPIQICHEAER